VQPPVFKASTNVSFTMNTEPLNQQMAQEACNGVCGHLAAYRSAREQSEVEQYYITQVCPCALLYAGCHRWSLGAASNEALHLILSIQ
jgi:hypothetical protein